jgi:hypothetical protein
MDDEYEYIASEDTASNNPLDDDLMTYMMFFADEEEAQARASHGAHNHTQPNYGCVVVPIAAVIVVVLLFLYVLFQS